MDEPSLTIGELARRTGVAPSALRYWEELGVLPPPARISGQRRYPEAAVALVGAILLLRDAGYSLAEQKALAHADGVAPGERERLQRRKLAELDDQIARAEAAREAIEHGLRCPHEDFLRCPNFGKGVAARLAGKSLGEAHAQLHEADAEIHEAGARPRAAHPRLHEARSG